MKKVQECGLLALCYATLLPHLLQQLLKGLNFDSMLRFEQRNLAPESRLARRERFYAALGTGTMRSGTVDLLSHIREPLLLVGAFAPSFRLPFEHPNLAPSSHLSLHLFIYVCMYNIIQ